MILKLLIALTFIAAVSADEKSGSGESEGELGNIVVEEVSDSAHFLCTL